jgi:hypothetical protein
MQSEWRHKGYFYYDWLLRDFFLYLHGRADQCLLMPGTYEPISLGNDWLSRAESAYSRAVKACSFEQHNLINMAGDEWQKIFGSDVPRNV